MIAARLTGYREELILGTVAEPDCPRDGVIVEVLACGICRSDWHVWVGADPDVSLPHIPGHEFCGVVVETGADIGRWRKGDRVIAPFILACGACSACQAGQQTTCDAQVLPGFTTQGAFLKKKEKQKKE